ncbi:MAG: TetR/AcrR family transcriptional regulator [Bacteroidetes bacterium]|nr:TetR/AcrR family transcriptional regulator [Bacteroidota bacterium]
MGKGRDIWIQTGYTQFAIHGPESVNVEQLAGLVGKSRSSFYHNFGDAEGYEEALFEYHAGLTLKFAEAIEPIESMFPQYANIVEQFRDWVFFHRQVFLLRNNKKKYDDVFKATLAITSPKTSELWCKQARLCDVPTAKMQQFLYTVREAFLTRIEYTSFTAENFTKVIHELNDAFSFLIK